MKETRETFQKSCILETVKSSDEHPTAEAIYALIKEKYPQISLGTVYRNLNLLARQGVIKRIESFKVDAFDHRLDDHHHFKCLDCGHIYDVQIDNEVIFNIKESSEYEVDYFQIAFFGRCTTCINKNEKEKK